MRNVISMVAGVALIAALVMPVFAADMTIKGDIVDVACATDKKHTGKGDDHTMCAVAGAKRGDPVAVKTADALYLIIGDYAANKNAKLLDFAARKVIATGEVTEKDGVKSINIKSIKLAS
jgi:type 1 fimbria pilin